MKVTRRTLIAGAAASGLLAGKIIKAHGDSVQIGHGWNTLPVGCGGAVVGFDIAPDNTMVVRTDVGGVYRWSGTSADLNDPTKCWVQLLTFDSLKNIGKPDQI